MDYKLTYYKRQDVSLSLVEKMNQEVLIKNADGSYDTKKWFDVVIDNLMKRMAHHTSVKELKEFLELAYSYSPKEEVEAKVVIPCDLDETK